MSFCGLEGALTVAEAALHFSLAPRQHYFEPLWLVDPQKILPFHHLWTLQACIFVSVSTLIISRQVGHQRTTYLRILDAWLTLDCFLCTPTPIQYTLHPLSKYIHHPSSPLLNRHGVLHPSSSRSPVQSSIPGLIQDCRSLPLRDSTRGSSYDSCYERADGDHECELGDDFPTFGGDCH